MNAQLYIAAIWRAAAKTLADRRFAYLATQDERRDIVRAVEMVERQLLITEQLYRPSADGDAAGAGDTQNNP